MIFWQFFKANGFVEVQFFCTQIGEQNENFFEINALGKFKDEYFLCAADSW
jgi:hypothetical protein